MKLLVEILLITALISFTIVICIAAIYKEEIWDRIEFK